MSCNGERGCIDFLTIGKSFLMCKRKKGLSDDKILQFLSFFRLWGHDEFVERGGIYKLELKDNKIVSNGGFFCNGVRSLANYSDHAIAFSDTGDCKSKVLNPDIKKCFVLVGDGQGTRDGSKTQFSQSKGIFNDIKTLFTVDTSTAALPMTSNVSSLLESDLKYLHLLAEKFGIHLKREAPLAVEREPAIERRELVYQFDQECVDNVNIVTGTRGETQGSQETVSLPAWH